MCIRDSGGIVGSLAGQRLLVPIMVGYGSQCIDIKSKEKINPKEDIAEVLDAYVIGEVEEPLEKSALRTATAKVEPPIYEYKKLHEKMCVKIAVKVVRWEHVQIKTEERC